MIDSHRHGDPAELLHDLRACLRPPESDFEFTEDGLWHPTPLDVVVDVACELEEFGPGEEKLRVMDAGAGDGRWLVALGLWARRTGRAVDVRGAETDAGLFEAAGVALRRADLEVDVELTNTDYLADRDTLIENDVVLHYPDGNEHELARLLVGSDTELWIVTSQLNSSVDGLELRRMRPVPRLPRVGSIDWHLFVYAAPISGIPSGRRSPT